MLAHQNVIVGTSFAEQYSSGSIVVGECWLLRARGEVWEAVGVLTERTKKRSVKPRVNFNALEQGVSDIGQNFLGLI